MKLVKLMAERLVQTGWGQARLSSFRTHSWDRLTRFSPFQGVSARSREPNVHSFLWGGRHLCCPWAAACITTSWAVSSARGVLCQKAYVLILSLQPPVSSLSALLLRTRSKCTNPLGFTSFLPYQFEPVCSAPLQRSLATPAHQTTNLHSTSISLPIRHWVTGCYQASQCLSQRPTSRSRLLH